MQTTGFELSFVESFTRAETNELNTSNENCTDYIPVICQYSFFPKRYEIQETGFYQLQERIPQHQKT